MTQQLTDVLSAVTPFPERAIRTYEDWHAFVAKPVAVKPPMVSRAEYDAMSKTDRDNFNRARFLYHNAFGPIFVPAMEGIHDAALRLASQNLRAQPGARPGIIMDGISTVGKSTIAMQLGRRYERVMTKEHTITRTPSGSVFVPVAFVSLPGEVSILNFNMILARFYNIPFAKSVRAEILTDQIKEHAADCGTSMVILDDIHFLQIKNRTHATVNKHIKSLANSISATFVYAGIKLNETGLLTEGLSKEKENYTQTGHRFKKFDLTPFDFRDARSKKEFLAVLTEFEKHLLLFNQKPQSLALELGQYIWKRTGGYMGPISTLIREGAALAIKTKSECLNLEVLQKIKLDYDSENNYAIYKKIDQASAQRSAS